MMKSLLLRILHRVNERICSYTVIKVDPFSRERKLVCVSCGRTKEVFYV